MFPHFKVKNNIKNYSTPIGFVYYMLKEKCVMIFLWSTSLPKMNLPHCKYKYVQKNISYLTKTKRPKVSRPLQIKAKWSLLNTKLLIIKILGNNISRDSLVSAFVHSN